jgi:purine-binding chemotaxis protein CheW
MTDEMSVLTVYAGKDCYALPIEHVVEVAAMMEFSPLPEAVPELLGVVNRHGDVLPLVDFRQVMGHQAPPVDAQSLFVVVQHENLLVGLVVDAIQHVTTIPSRMADWTNATSPYVRGIMSHEDRLIKVVAVPPFVEAYVSDGTTRQKG